MKVSEQQRTREEMAWREVGQTTIGPAGALILVGAFLVMIFGAPIHQAVTVTREARAAGEDPNPPVVELVRRARLAFDPVREQGFGMAALLEVNRRLLSAINDHEDVREDTSRLSMAIRPVVQGMATRWLGAGNEQVYLGREGWLFYRPGMDSVTGPPFLSERQLARRAASGSELVTAPQPDPRKAIVDVHRQLAERGIVLVVMPTPVKPTIHPERFSGRFRGRGEPVQNASFGRWVAELEAEGVWVYDPSRLLAARRTEDQYLATDTHWRPEAMEAVAADLAGLLRERGLVTAGDVEAWMFDEVEVEHHGDLVPMLDLAGDQRLYPKERVRVRQVVDRSGQFWSPDGEAEILLLGDSFSNIYSLEPMGWGEAAGFAEHLSAALGAPLDRMVRNDGGAFATREMLGRELGRGRDRLAGKQVVVWQFAARELAVGDWRLVGLDVGDPPEGSFVVPDRGERVEVRGVVREVSAVPRPGTVPYRDHVMSVHLVDLPEHGQAVVYLRSMVDGEWTRAARLRPGEEVSMRLRRWDEVAGSFDAFNRSELDDWELQLQEPAWGELL
ncbi:MAG TPA: hypothetical protein PKE55_04690 [Kiritimatiellia bacterium]|nr:hypothetical protein [Kiritimatiellia bacterium]